MSILNPRFDLAKVTDPNFIKEGVLCTCNTYRGSLNFELNMIQTLLPFFRSSPLCNGYSKRDLGLVDTSGREEALEDEEEHDYYYGKEEPSHPGEEEGGGIGRDEGGCSLVWTMVFATITMAFA